MRGTTRAETSGERLLPSACRSCLLQGKDGGEHTRLELSGAAGSGGRAREESVRDPPPPGPEAGQARSS